MRPAWSRCSRNRYIFYTLLLAVVVLNGSFALQLDPTTGTNRDLVPDGVYDLYGKGPANGPCDTLQQVMLSICCRGSARQHELLKTVQARIISALQKHSDFINSVGIGDYLLDA